MPTKQKGPLGRHLKAWRKARGLNQVEAAKEFGVSQPTFHKWEEKGTKPDDERMALIVQKTGYDPTAVTSISSADIEVTRGPGEALVAIRGYALPGGSVHFVDEATETAALPAGMPPDNTVAIRINMGAGVPINTWVVYYREPPAHNLESCIDRLCVAKMRAGGAFYLRLVRRTKTHSYALQGMAGEFLADAEIDWAAPIEWMWSPP